MSPAVSVIVGAYDMARELPRTVRSLLPPYQAGLQPGEVEVLIADNGSTAPIDPASFGELAPLVRILRFEGLGPSPVRAMNAAIAQARAEALAVVIDGARMASPGVLDLGRRALGLAPHAFAATLGFHLGPKTQQVSTTEGYDQAEEDRLLARIGWPADGYRLFEICAAGESGRAGALAPLPETNLFVTRKATWARLGGFDERFVGVGGGLANHDLFERVRLDPAVEPVLLLGEGTFHQLHYGATTQADGVRRKVAEDGATLWDRYMDEYHAIVGEERRLPAEPHLLFGRVRSPAARRFFFPEP